jgi:hypothetical protein
MDEVTRLRGIVQWYSTNLQGATLQIAQLSVENAALKNQVQKQAEKEGETDAQIHSGAETG